MRPLAIDLFCGLGGWTEGLLAEGYRVVGFDMERHRYPARDMPPSSDRKVARDGVDFNSTSADSRDRSFNYANQCAVRDAPLTGGWTEYPAQLVIQDVLTLHGSQFKDAALIVASPPCQSFSYMAMPWSKAKQIEREYLSGVRDVAELTALFDACFRIQREACEAAGRHIPMVVENVRGAQKWVGRSRWNFGSFHLWGDVPALMPIPGQRRPMKEGIAHRPNGATNFHGHEAMKNTGGSWLNIGSPGQKETNNNPVNQLAYRRISEAHRSKSPAKGYGGVSENGIKQLADGIKSGGDWFNDSQPSISRLTSSKSPARKMASAMIAKIPFVLSSHIARSWRP